MVGILEIDPLNARGDAGVDVPGDCLGLGSEFGDGNVGTEEFDFVALLDFGGIGDVDHHLVHGDATKDGEKVFSHKNARSMAGGVAWVAIAVADADGGNAGGSGGDKAATVGNAVSGRQGADQGDARLEGHDGLQFFLMLGQG